MHEDSLLLTGVESSARVAPRAHKLCLACSGSPGVHGRVITLEILQSRCAAPISFHPTALVGSLQCQTTQWFVVYEVSYIAPSAHQALTFTLPVYFVLISCTLFTFLRLMLCLGLFAYNLFSSFCPWSCIWLMCPFPHTWDLYLTLHSHPV